MNSLPTDTDSWIIRAVALIIFLGAIGLGFLARRFVFRALRRWAARTAAGLVEAIVVAVQNPFILWCACAGFYAAGRLIPLPGEVTRVSDRVLLVLVIVSATYAVARAAITVVRQVGTRRGSSVAYVGLTMTIVRTTVVVLGGLMLLDALGISITPMITALGIGGLAVALALQDTLANTFAGVYITLSRHIRPGDYIRIEDGHEGVVTDITWRATTMRTIRNNIIIIPNAKLAQSVVTNFHLREPQHRLDIAVNVSYSSDPDHVETVLLDETAKAVGEVENLLAQPAPYVLFMPGFGDYSLNFTLIVYVRSYPDQYQVQHQLRKRIFRRLRQEGIEIPFPIRTVLFRGKPTDEA